MFPMSIMACGMAAMRRWEVSSLALLFDKALQKDWQAERKEEPDSQALLGWEEHSRVSQPLWYKRNTCTNKPVGDEVVPLNGSVWARDVTK